MKASKAHKKTTSSGQVRIISGRWRGRKIPVADAEGLRPTTDRVRETLFNWLMHDLADRQVLDCFAGSGVLALEALSRGARHATVLEQDRQLAAQLIDLYQQLGANADVIQTDTLRHLRTTPAMPYQLVFIDPPFRQGLAEPCCQLLEQHHWLADDALIYLETEKELALTSLPANWLLRKEKIAGQLAYRLFERTQRV